MTKIKSIVLCFATALIISGSASAQSISIVSGNGQLTCQACPTIPITIFNPLVVQVKDATGKLVPGATIAWTFNSNATVFGNVGQATTTTDANGQASNTISLSPALGSLFATSFVQATITAAVTALPAGTAGTVGQSVTFTETNALTDIQQNAGSGSGIVQVSATFVSPAVGTSITGPAGSTSTTPIQVRVAGLLGGGVPGVAVILQPPTDSTAPSISCAPVPGGQPNTALTDASGTATCNVVFGPRLGSGTATVAVGQVTPQAFAVFTNAVSFTVTQGVPGAIQISTGNNQSGNAGAALTAPLVAIVTDQAGNPLSGANVVWTVTQGAATLTNTRTTSDATGRVSTNLTLGSTPGNVTVTVAVQGSPQISAAFTATVNLAVSQLQKLAGDNQSTPVSTAFPNALVVQVNNNGAPVSGVTVNFTVVSGAVTLGTASPTTNTQGQAQTTATAGATAGAAVVRATVGTFTADFNLTVSPPGPALTASSFRNAASGQVGAVSPCSLATIVAQGLAPGIQGTIAPPIVGVLPLQVNNTTVAFLNPQTNSNSFAPIYSVSNISGSESMIIQIPCELSPGSVNVTVNVSSGSKSVAVNLLPAAPGIFETRGSDNKFRGVLIRPDGTFATRENPARRGETIHMLATGLGPVVPQIGTNQVGIPDTDSNVSDAVVVGVNNAGVQVVSATYARDLIGIYDIGFVVPADTPAGDINLALAVNLAGTLTFGNGSIIPVQ
jgi:uncharacterized protein (TIGR03437 family)